MTKQVTVPVENRYCHECGMPCKDGEYHPYAACLMFMASKKPETVRANLKAVMEKTAAPQPQTEEYQDERRDELLLHLLEHVGWYKLALPSMETLKELLALPQPPKSEER